jgi:beta-lactamase superfamily II metal-dependent hydrolase
MISIKALDGGKGDCYLVENNDEHYLIDGGNKAIDNNILPNRLDKIIISHNDIDHVKGIIFLLKNSSVNDHLQSRWPESGL